MGGLGAQSGKTLMNNGQCTVGQRTVTHTFRCPYQDKTVIPTCWRRRPTLQVMGAGATGMGVGEGDGAMVGGITGAGVGEGVTGAGVGAGEGGEVGFGVGLRWVRGRQLIFLRAVILVYNFQMCRRSAILNRNSAVHSTIILQLGNDGEQFRPARCPRTIL